MSFIQELKRRNVLRVGAAYIVTAWLVVQVAETLFPVYGLSDNAIRVVVNVLAVGLVPVLVLSWVFEWTPEGLKRDAQVDDDAPSSVAAAKRLDRIILVILALALGYFAFDKFVLAPKQMSEELAQARQEGRSEAIVESFGDASIAVLAFENMSSDPEQEYFADGIAEEILNLLAGIPELRVISRSSAFTYKGKDTPIPRIASELNVAHVLEGSVRKAGNQIRVTAQLIEGHSDMHLWSQTWDRTMEDVFAIQDEIAKDVVGQLQLRLTQAVPTSQPTNLETYSLTLKAKHLLELSPAEFREDGFQLLERALELDPHYVPALELIILADWFGGDDRGLTQEELEQRYLDFTQRILAIDPNNGTVQAYRAWDLYNDEKDIEGSVQLLEQALRHHPNDTEIMRTGAAIFRRIGRPDLAVPLAQHCVRLEPSSGQCLWLLKDVHLWAGDLDLAFDYMQRVRTLWNQPVRTFDPLLLIMRGDYQGALVMMDAWPQSSVQAMSMHAIAAYQLGDFEAYEKSKKALLSDGLLASGEPTALDMIVSLYAYTGDFDEAFRWLDRLIEFHPVYVFSHLLGPPLAPLHEDPRWESYRERVGLGRERTDNIPFTMPSHIPPATPRLGLD